MVYKIRMHKANVGTTTLFVQSKIQAFQVEEEEKKNEKSPSYFLSIYKMITLLRPENLIGIIFNCECVFGCARKKNKVQTPSSASSPHEKTPKIGVENKNEGRNMKGERNMKNLFAL